MYCTKHKNIVIALAVSLVTMISALVVLQPTVRAAPLPRPSDGECVRTLDPAVEARCAAPWVAEECPAIKDQAKQIACYTQSADKCAELPSNQQVACYQKQPADSCAPIKDPNAKIACYQKPAPSTPSVVGNESANSDIKGIDRQKDPAEECIKTDINDVNKLEDNCNIIAKILNPIVNFLTVGVGLFITAMIIMGGIQYSAAGGDPSKVSEAKNRIRNAILALIIFIFFGAFLQYLVPGGLF